MSHPSGRTWPRVAEGVVAAGLTATVVLLARWLHLLEGRLALTVLVIALLAVPTSREMSRRVLVMGTLALGWVPVLWWLPVPAPEVGRASLLLAGVTAGLAGWVFSGPGRAARADRLLPRVRSVDALPLVVALAAAFVVRPWLRAPSPDGALAMLMHGWDHSAHYDMVHMMRTHGVGIGALGPALLGDTWSYARYPHGFHALAATLMEVQAGDEVGSAGAEVLLYGQALGLLAVISATVLAAGVCALPRLRRRPLVAAPVVMVAAGGFLLGPGSRLLSDGFPNFALACVLLACLPLLVVPLDKGPLPLHLAAIGGALVGIAHGWVLLLTMALPAVVVLLLPGRRRRFLATRRAWLASVAVIVATGLGIGVAVAMVVGQPVTEVLVIQGSVSAPQLRLLIGPPLLAGVVCAVLLWRMRRRAAHRRPDVLRVVASASVPVVGLACALGIAWLQLRAGLPLGYYFWKFAIALALVSLVIGAIAAAWLLPARWGLVSRPSWAWAGAGVATLAATQLYGLTVPGAALGGVDLVPPGLEVRAELTAVSNDPSPVTGQLFAAVDATLAPDRRHVFLVHPADVGINPVTAGQWYNALAGRWTDQSNEVLKMLLAPTATPQEVAVVASSILVGDPDVVVIVDPARLVELRAAIGDEALAARVTSW
ncbi:hypothetical protein [Cellulomonas sp. KRMCY2]|uniref:hypothetical protein n=1 Tax=Cellulomonas sp. KRMCY2 TaxID=1304865 RepID=UPI00045EC694|nr:hypothetical protein [Cellulomonas sp. KRMCY2]